MPTNTEQIDRLNRELAELAGSLRTYEAVTNQSIESAKEDTTANADKSVEPETRVRALEEVKGRLEERIKILEQKLDKLSDRWWAVAIAVFVGLIGIIATYFKRP